MTFLKYGKMILQIFLTLVVGGETIRSKSPCPNIFNYKQVSGLWIGRLGVQVQIKDLPISVHVHLSLRAALKSKYVGLLELVEIPETALAKLIEFDGGRVNYTVRFPLPDPLPAVRNIYLNDISICKGPKVIGQVVTDIHLEHTFPTNPSIYNRTLKYEAGGEEVIPVELTRNCGQTTIPLSRQNGKILGNGEWPWLAGIFLRKESSLQFHCSGSLISLNYVVTAAHCLQDQNYEELEIESFVVYLGRFNLKKLAEPNSQTRDVVSVSVHPDFTTSFYAADIAVMELSSPVTYSDYVRPVCLWSGTTSLQPLMGRLGLVAGWGKDRANGPIRTEPRIVQLPVVDQEECLRSRKDFFYITSDRTLCAGFRNGTGPCNGDSGGGLIFLARDRRNRLAWQLRGVISLSLLDQTLQTCDLKHYVVFTDAAKFITWLVQVTK